MPSSSRFLRCALAEPEIRFCFLAVQILRLYVMEWSNMSARKEIIC
jgi:hypothetical protein